MTLRPLPKAVHPIAEQFGTLATLYPDGIDLGLGRAPGTTRAPTMIQGLYPTLAEVAPVPIQATTFVRVSVLWNDSATPYDTWHFNHQNQEFLALAKSVPETTMILDHFGTPLGVGAYAGKQDEIFE